MKVDDETLAVLSRCVTDGPSLVLPSQLDRQDYLRVNKVLEAAGGKWNRRARAHLFDGPAADAIDPVLLTGQVSTHQEMGFFPTPPPVITRLLGLADLGEPGGNGLTVLEPSAGEGAIAARLAGWGCTVDCVEIDPRRAAKIPAGVARRLLAGDFLAYQHHPLDTEYDRVVMNPPFARQQDIDHVRHALTFLRPGGRLVSVMAKGVLFRQDRKATEFRELVYQGGMGWFEPLPDDSFQAAGTGVRTVIVTIPRRST